MSRDPVNPTASFTCEAGRQLLAESGRAAFEQTLSRADVAARPIAKELIVRNPADIQRIYLFLGDSIIANKPNRPLISPEVAGSVWKQNNEMADKANEPGKFTAFCSYEWTLDAQRSENNSRGFQPEPCDPTASCSGSMERTRFRL